MQLHGGKFMHGGQQILAQQFRLISLVLLLPSFQHIFLFAFDLGFVFVFFAFKLGKGAPVAVVHFIHLRIYTVLIIMVCFPAILPKIPSRALHY